MLFSSLFNKIVEQLYFKQEGNLALYDRLTRVYNYNWFNLIGNKKYIDKAIFVTVIDINGFKQINDTKGHLEGNNILKQVADQLVFMKTYDESIEVVRYGGDEFVVLSESDPSTFLELCNKETDLLSYGVVRKEQFEPLSVAFVKADDKMYKFKQDYKKNLQMKRENKNGLGIVS